MSNVTSLAGSPGLTPRIRLLNSRLYSFLQASKASKLNSLVGPLPVSVNNHANSAVQTNLVVTIPPDLTLSDSERSVLAKGLKFVPSPGSLDFFSVKTDIIKPPSLKRMCLRQSILKKIYLVSPEDQFGSLELFIRQCRHDIDTLPKFRPKRPINLTESELTGI